MVINNKKGYLKTFEAVVAILILLGVILYSLSLKQTDSPTVPEDIKLAQRTAVDKIENDPVMRTGFFSCDLTTTVNLAQFMAQMFDSLNSTLYTPECKELLNSTELYPTIPINQPVYTTSLIMFDKDNQARTVVIQIWRKGV